VQIKISQRIAYYGRFFQFYGFIERYSGFGDHIKSKESKVFVGVDFTATLSSDRSFQRHEFSPILTFLLLKTQTMQRLTMIEAMLT
jgi:hypothetical protein